VKGVGGGGADGRAVSEVEEVGKLAEMWGRRGGKSGGVWRS